MCMPIAIVQCGRDVPPPKSYVDLTSRLLSAISGDATIICCVGSRADFVKVLDKSLGQKVGVQDLMGRIDMCSMLRALLLRLIELLDERWVQLTQYFRKVRIGNNSLWLPREYNFGMILSCLVGPRRWKIRIVYCVSCGAGDDHSLASDCRVYQ